MWPLKAILQRKKKGLFRRKCFKCGSKQT
jgi:hypothetical protein